MSSPAAEIVSIESLVRWNTLPATLSAEAADTSSVHEEHEQGQEQQEDEESRFPFDETLNRKLVLYQGSLCDLEVDAIVNSTNERLNDRTGISGTVFKRAGPELLAECLRTDPCHTGEAVITPGFDLVAPHVIHTVGPRYSVKYQTAAENALHSCIRRSLELMLEHKLESIAFPLVNTARKGYPKEAAAHIVLRTVRRFIERYGSTLHTIIFCMDNAEDVAVYERVMPLYFPRDEAEEAVARGLLPEDTGNELGESVIRERQIRISAMPGGFIGAGPTAAATANRPVGASASTRIYNPSISSDAFVEPQANPDEQSAAPSATAAEDEATEAEKLYAYYVAQAQEQDFSDMEEHGFLYTSGHDTLGREIVIFVANRLPAKTADLHRVLLYMIHKLDSIVENDYCVVYLHTNIQDHNKPPLSWMREVYSIFDRKYKKNLKRLHIVHPSWWVKVVLLFASPFISKKFWKKLVKLDRLVDLYEDYEPDTLRIPEDVVRYDQEYNGDAYASEYDDAAGTAGSAGADEDDGL